MPFYVLHSKIPPCLSWWNGSSWENSIILKRRLPGCILCLATASTIRGWLFRGRATRRVFSVSLTWVIYKWYYKCMLETRSKSGSLNSQACTWHFINLPTQEKRRKSPECVASFHGQHPRIARTFDRHKRINNRRAPFVGVCEFSYRTSEPRKTRRDFAYTKEKGHRSRPNSSSLFCDTPLLLILL